MIDLPALAIVDGASNSVSVSSSTGSASLSLSNTVIRGQDEDVWIAATGIPVSLDDVEINGCPTTPISVSGVTLSLSGVELSDAGPGRSGGIEVFASEGVIEDLRVSGGDATVGGALMVTQPGDRELAIESSSYGEASWAETVVARPRRSSWSSSRPTAPRWCSTGSASATTPPYLCGNPPWPGRTSTALEESSSSPGSVTSSAAEGAASRRRIEETPQLERLYVLSA